MQNSKCGSLEAAVTKHLRKFTVTVTPLQILEDHLLACKLRRSPTGLPLRDIAKGYNSVAKSVGKPTFFGSYVQRHAKSGDLFQEANGRYRFRDELLVGLKLGQIVRLRNRIISHLKQLQERKRAVDAQFREFYELPISDVDIRRDFIVRKLHTSDGNAGQNFEIMSFAILCVYFRIFGFSLRRFSTTFSNDGGMDFIAGEGIYQVTTVATDQKIASDLAKLPERDG